MKIVHTEASKVQKEFLMDSSYMKLVQNKTHMGPVSEEKAAKAKAKALSAAAYKIKIDADLVPVIDTDSITNVIKKNQSNAKTYLLSNAEDNSTDGTIVSAFYIMQAWDDVFGDSGTPDYVEKFNAAIIARREAYSKLGINPSSDRKPILSKEERTVYNSIVGPTKFDYYEYHLAFKLAGNKRFVRSKTYRSLRPLDVNSLIAKLSKRAEQLQQQIAVKVKEAN
jgi:hypothetical protein